MSPYEIDVDLYGGRSANEIANCILILDASSRGKESGELRVTLGSPLTSKKEGIITLRANQSAFSGEDENGEHKTESDRPCDTLPDSTSRRVTTTKPAARSQVITASQTAHHHPPPPSSSARCYPPFLATVHSQQPLSATWNIFSRPMTKECWTTLPEYSTVVSG